MRSLCAFLCLAVSVAAVGCDCPSPAGPAGQTNNNSNSASVLTLSVAGQSSIKLNQTATFTATAHFSDGTTTDVTQQATWTTDNSAICTVMGNGSINGKAVGNCSVTANYSNALGQAGLLISTDSNPNPNPNPNPIPSVVGLTITGNGTLVVGQTSQLQATAQFSDGTSQVVTSQSTWISSGPSIVSVTAGGLLTGIGAGTTPVSATYTGKTAQLTVTVSKASSQKQLIGIDVTADVDLAHISLNSAVQLHVFGVYSDGSKQDVTSAAVITPDTPLLQVNGAGLINVVLTLADVLINPTHVINVKYGGFSATVEVTVTLPLIQSLQLTNGNTLTANAGTKLPSLQAIFQNGLTATVDATTPGLTWSLTPTGLLGGLLNTLGVSLSDVLNFNGGVLSVVNTGLLNQLLTLLGGALHVDGVASFQGVSSAPLHITIGS